MPTTSVGLLTPSALVSYAPSICATTTAKPILSPSISSCAVSSSQVNSNENSWVGGDWASVVKQIPNLDMESILGDYGEDRRDVQVYVTPTPDAVSSGDSFTTADGDDPVNQSSVSVRPFSPAPSVVSDFFYTPASRAADPADDIPPLQLDKCASEIAQHSKDDTVSGIAPSAATISNPGSLDDGRSDTSTSVEVGASSTGWLRSIGTRRKEDEVDHIPTRVAANDRDLSANGQHGMRKHASSESVESSQLHEKNLALQPSASASNTPNHAPQPPSIALPHAESSTIALDATASARDVNSKANLVSTISASASASRDSTWFDRMMGGPAPHLDSLLGGSAPTRKSETAKSQTKKTKGILVGTTVVDTTLGSYMASQDRSEGGSGRRMYIWMLT